MRCVSSRTKRSLPASASAGAGRAAGVEDGRQLVAPLLLEPLLQSPRNARLVLLPARHQLRERQRPLAVALAFDQDAAAHGRKLTTDFAQLAQLLVVFD